MKVIQSTGSTEISGVRFSNNGASCKLTWNAASGGVIICFSPGFNPIPDMGEISERLSEANLRSLLQMGTLNLGPDLTLVYMNEGKVMADAASYEFTARGTLSLPLKVQLFSVSANGETVYVPNTALNKVVIPAELRLSLEPAGMFKKGKKIAVTGANLAKFPEGFLCYTVPGAPYDGNNLPMEYPIPKGAIEAGYVIPLEDFRVDVARKWSNLVNLEVSEGKQ